MGIQGDEQSQQSSIIATRESALSPTEKKLREPDTPVLAERVKLKQQADERKITSSSAEDGSGTVSCTTEDRDGAYTIVNRPPELLDGGAEQLVGLTLNDQYAILELIGQGGMSAVYKAKELKLGKLVAVKVMLPHVLTNEKTKQRFLLEARATASLNHPNIVSVHNYGSTEAFPYLVMDYVQGEPLSDWINERGAIPSELAIPIFLHIVDAMAHAHQQNVLHRDLKPSNVMLVHTSNEQELVKLVDFGIAKMLPEQGMESMHLTQTGELFGSPLYMSPEQCRGETLDVRSDVYAMGCLMYEVLSGQPPLRGSSISATILKQMSETPEPFESLDKSLKVPHRLEAIVFKALAKSPSQRHQSMSELRQELEQFHLERTGNFLGTLLSRAQVLALRVSPLGKREQYLLWTILCLAVIVIATSSVFLNRLNTFSSTPPMVARPDPRFAVQQKTDSPNGESTKAMLAIAAQKKLAERLNFLYAPTKSSTQYERAELWKTLGDQLASARAYDEAAENYRKYYNYLYTVDGPTQANTLMALRALALCLFQAGKEEQALSRFNELSRLMPHDTAVLERYLPCAVERAKIMYKLGHYSEAVPVFEELLNWVNQKKVDMREPQYAACAARLAECYRLLNQYDKAEKWYRAADDAWARAEFSKSDERRIACQYYIAATLLAQDRVQEAAAQFDDVVPRMKAVLGTRDPLCAIALRQQANALWRTGSYWDSTQAFWTAEELHTKYGTTSD